VKEDKEELGNVVEDEKSKEDRLMVTSTHPPYKAFQLSSPSTAICEKWKDVNL